MTFILLVLLYQNFYEKTLNYILLIKKRNYNKRLIKAKEQLDLYECDLREKYEIFWHFNIPNDHIAYELMTNKISELNKKHKVRL